MLDICSGKRGRISGVTPSSETATEAEILDKYLAIHFPHKVHPELHGNEIQLVL